MHSPVKKQCQKQIMDFVVRPGDQLAGIFSIFFIECFGMKFTRVVSHAGPATLREKFVQRYTSLYIELLQGECYESQESEKFLRP